MDNRMDNSNRSHSGKTSVMAELVARFGLTVRNRSLTEMLCVIRAGEVRWLFQWSGPH